MDEFEVLDTTDKEMIIRHKPTGHEWSVRAGVTDEGKLVLSPSMMLRENEDADPAAGELADDMMAFADFKMRRSGMIDP